MRGTKPTVRQAKLITKMGLQYKNWLVMQDTSTYMKIMHRISGQKRTINKMAGGEADA